MQASQRPHYNQALEYAIEKANALRKPVVVLFVLTDQYPQANARHYRFMLEGLAETGKKLASRGITMVVRYGRPPAEVVEFARAAVMVVTDCGHLRIQRAWRQKTACLLSCAMHEVESNLVVPVWSASEKLQYSAATIRPRITAGLERRLVRLQQSKPKVDSLSANLGGLDIGSSGTLASKLNIDKSVGASPCLVGGTSKARKLLAAFIRNGLEHYGHRRNDPCADCTSNMSPYLHFGQISPLFIALEVVKSGKAGGGAYLEELIVRRELAHNMVFYNRRYDTFRSLPAWAKATLLEHRRDRRPYLYSLAELENARTHDAYWNAAQRQMAITGKMHGYMRMYWGKKILEWTANPRTAFKRALYLNDKYEIDGRDANGFAGVAWCFGLHDRPWKERPIFGMVRYMNASGLERKFDMDRYVRRIESLKAGTENSESRIQKPEWRSPG